MRSILILGWILAGLLSSGQDTIRFMHYNLLNYGNNYGDCNTSNNNVADKNEYLKILVDFIRPDVLSVNEIDDQDSYHENILNNVLNINGTTSFKRGDPPNLGYSPIMNEIYYDSDKLLLLSNTAIETNYRDIDLFNFLYKADSQQDSIFLTNVVAHLKAGSDPSDEQERASETYKLMNYLNTHNLTGNYVLSGDLNLRSGLSSAFQNLLAFPNEAIRFYDPLNKVGYWHDEASYASIHTQSTHLSGGCPAGGGLDDRFDFFLLTEKILQGADHVHYVEGSYQAVGQDGMRLNKSLMNPGNTSVPEAVLTALFGMSDHLPIVIDLAVGQQIGGFTENKPAIGLEFQNPASRILQLKVSIRSQQAYSVTLLDPFGNVSYRADIRDSDGELLQIPVAHLPSGVYFIRVATSRSLPVTEKVIISH